MGFFLKELEHTIQLHPRSFGQHLHKMLRERLHEEVEGTCTGRHGYIIAVLEITHVGHGVLQNTTGYAEYTISYRGIVFKPFKHQVLQGIVTTVNTMGFFCSVGPLTVFVSSHMIPQNLRFDNSASRAAYVSDAGSMGHDATGAPIAAQARIESGETVRIRIIGTRVDASAIFAIGTIKEDYLGPVATM
ncbi:hypothetical protein CXG81DRAFT_28045 [Caulochytrium protostelioides]|uniref:DNA-directed RNA polymerase II subunit RPB7 n=1 Tax=Caulochytrium protostelioides TaxID=1555241 RepID=A0A4P9X001_9FUNG|nr:hypothetical protein CXG81DRAFT_28045 [Caulochytrium protostelioides]|eukprot:RKO99179.1 hypothetical protein CXG81DRAFT_28045 [Caulochytrium protostelioides]